MAKSVPDQNEQDMMSSFHALNYQNSRVIGDFQCLTVSECVVNGHPDATGYWIGTPSYCYAYLVVNPMRLGSQRALEAIRGWVHPAHRRRKMHSHLLQTASGTDRSVLVGDRNGITAATFIAWHKVPGFAVKYFDVETSNLVEEASVPELDRHTAYANGDRWLLVLEPV